MVNDTEYKKKLILQAESHTAFFFLRDSTDRTANSWFAAECKQVSGREKDAQWPNRLQAKRKLATPEGNRGVMSGKERNQLGGFFVADLRSQDSAKLFYVKAERTVRTVVVFTCSAAVPKGSRVLGVGIFPE